MRKLAQKVVKIYQVKFENENVAGSHFIAEAHQICMLSKHSEWATREAAASMGEKLRDREREREEKKRGWHSFAAIPRRNAQSGDIK